MASGKGMTFKIGKMMFNLSGRGIATKDSETGEIRRYPFPWAQVPKQEPEYAPEDEQYEDGYDDADYDDEYDEAEYEADGGEYYVPEDEDGDYDAEQSESLLDAPWLMWLALVLLPPLGVWLLWRNNRFEIIVRSVLSALSLIWFIIMLIWLFTSMNSSLDETNTPPIVTPTPTIGATATPDPTDVPTATPVTAGTPTIAPSATPQTGADNTGDAAVNPSATPEQTWVWSKEGGENYHLDATCRGMEGANRVLLQVALNRRQTACPDCFPTEETTKPTATPIPEGSYFSRPDGTWYHTDPNCKGMTSAQVVTQAEAIERGQTACPTCVGSVYMTDGGANYHSNSSCRGMKNAVLTTVEKAIAAGKTACATCMDGASTGTTGTTVTGNAGTANNADGVYWYNPNGGKYYHTTSTCGGMKNAIQGSASAAENNGLTACPTCLGGTSASANFWYTTNGTWYHTKSNCQGMTGAVRVSEATAISRGKTACPECAGGTATGGTIVNVNTGNTNNNNNTTTTVTGTAGKYYSTVNGTNFHSSPTCRGMTGATEVDAKTIAERGQTPCAKCIGTSGIYYSTKDGTWYHSKSNCQGMTGADIVTLAMINARGQTACPTCIGGTTAGGTVTGTAYYWATADGSHFHSKSNCSGMRNAAKVTEAEAEGRGQTACPTCIGSVWGTADGQWYHKNRTCKGMNGAVRMTIQAAEKSGKTACPTCIQNAAPTTAPTATPAPTVTPKPGEDDADGKLYYYATDDGTYYHRKDNCTGMRGAKKVSEDTAKARGQKPCPTCIGSVYATEDGDHYHSKANCSGMRGASLVTVDTAELRGQSACPVCLEGDKGANEDTGNTGTDNNNTNNGGTTGVDPDTTMVYCTLTGEKYHSDRHCGGMRSAADVPLSWAIEHNYRRCTECNAPAAN